MSITANYIINPNIYDLSETLTLFDEIDAASVPISNFRGKLIIEGQASDEGVLQWSFSVNGGYGVWSTDPTQDWFFIQGSERNCTVDYSTKNVFVVTPVASDIGPGDREYTFTFYPTATSPFEIEKTAGTAFGTNPAPPSLSLKILKQQIFAV